MLAILKIRYTPMGEPMGVDLGTVIELVKLMDVSDPVTVIEKVMYLSHEIIKHGN